MMFNFFIDYNSKIRIKFDRQYPEAITRAHSTLALIHVTTLKENVKCIATNLLISILVKQN